MARTWTRADLIGTRNGSNKTFTIAGIPAGTFPLVIFNSRALYPTTEPIATELEFNVFASVVTLGLAPQANDNLWTIFPTAAVAFVSDDLIVANAPAGGAVARYILELRKTFYYTVHLLNKSGELVELWEKEISEIAWSYTIVGGCTEATITLRRPFDDFGPIEIESQIEIYRGPDPLAQGGAALPAVLPFTLSSAENISELRWSGFVRELEPVLEDDETVELRCSGWSRQLEYIAVVNQGPPPLEAIVSGDVGSIVRSIIDSYVIDRTQIKRTAALALVPDLGISVTGLQFLTSAAEALRTLASIAGDAEWGVRPDGEFYFLPRAQVVRQTHVIGKNVVTYRPRTSADDIVRRVYIQGSNGFTAAVDIAPIPTLPDPLALYFKERVVTVGAIANAADAALWAQGYAAKYAPANVSPSGRIRLGGTDEWVEQGGHIAGLAMGLLRVIGGPVFIRPGDPLSAELPFKLSTSYGSYTDTEFRVHSINYAPRNDSLAIDIDLGPRGNELADLLAGIEHKIGELRQAQI